MLRLYPLIGSVLLAGAGLFAQSAVGGATAQEDFAIAVARAHSRTSLVSADAMPWSMKATAVSRAALHGTGNGVLQEDWVDARHWQRKIQFPDFQESQFRNDSGPPWIERSNDAVPVRVSQLLEFVYTHVPSSSTAARYSVTESSTRSESGEALNCFSASRPTGSNGYPRNYRWCFDAGTGLLASEDMPIALHITFSDYIEFQGKQEFTRVHVVGGDVSILDINISYAPLDQHALDGKAPASTMRRSENAEPMPNPEEFTPSTVEYRYNPPLPPGTPTALKDKPVLVYFHLGPDTQIQDAAVEDAATDAMAQAALDAARKFTFTPLLLDGKPVPHGTLQSVWFQDEPAGLSAPAIAATGDTNGAEQNTDGAASAQTGVYRNEDLSFTFSYPAEFMVIPRAEVEAERGRAKLPSEATCNAVLSAVQHMGSGKKVPEAITLIDVKPACIFGMNDKKALESATLNGMHSITDHWVDPVLSKPKEYKMNGKSFVAVSASGIQHNSALESLNLLFIATAFHGDILAWAFSGPDDNLAEIARACTLQLDYPGRTQLLPPKMKP
jgi:hypothetical protein